MAVGLEGFVGEVVFGLESVSMSEVKKMTWRTITSRQTKHSRGRVVSMLRPKHLKDLLVLLIGGVSSAYHLQPRNVDHYIISREIIQNVPLRKIAE